MKNLKKRMLAAVLMAAMAMTTFANVTPAEAKSLTAKQYLTKMEKATEKAKSYEAKSTSVVNTFADGQTVNTKTVTNQIVFTDPVKIKTVSTMKVTGDMESKLKTIMYAKQTAKGNVYMYTSTDNGKTYDKAKVTGSLSDALGTDLGVKTYTNAKIVKKNVKVNKVNTVQISAQMDMDTLQKALEGTGLTDGEMDLSSLKPVTVTIWIDKKTYYPVKMKTDMTAFMNGFMQQLYESMGEELTDDVYSKLVTTMSYSKFNKATKFSIPKACK